MLQTASQSIVWQVPDGILEASPSDDFYTDEFQLTNHTKWRMCLRPCTSGSDVDGDDPEAPSRCIRSSEDSMNYLGLWLQNLDPTLEEAAPSAGMKYSLTLMTRSRRIIGSVNDNWLLDFWRGTRGTYWFATYADIRKCLRGSKPDKNLYVVFSGSFGTAGRFVPFWTAYQQMQDDLLYLRSGAVTLPVHAVLLRASNLRVRYRRTVDISDSLHSSALEVFVNLLYDPCEATLYSAKAGILLQLRQAFCKYQLSTHLAIVDSVLRQSAQSMSLSDLLAIRPALLGDPNGEVLFWLCLRRLTARSASDSKWFKSLSPVTHMKEPLSQLADLTTPYNEVVDKFIALRPVLRLRSLSRLDCLYSIFRHPFMARALARNIILFLTPGSRTTSSSSDCQVQSYPSQRFSAAA
eukprot:Gregarina_sp_Poly_1__2736@NODE_1757_length_3398_cov_8_837586_g1148_i0_p2_GENE_NODE_1757_length_3398_cov_8_837586_g1148_i0NODE_1757_length_3398_cov_8_837586_g1148_i0_p2_ORF_typecomplete_len407_score48_58_NODE_1757_length_3398_cov_8_837586_g1148_i0761296